MIQETSRIAYRRIKEEGLLPARRWEAYDIIARHGPITANQVMAIAKLEVPKRTHQYLESIGRRLSEIMEQKAIEIVGQVKCPISGHEVYLWATTGQLPVKLVKKRSKFDIKLEQAILKEREECARDAEPWSSIAAQAIRKRRETSS